MARRKNIKIANEYVNGYATSFAVDGKFFELLQKGNNILDSPNKRDVLFGWPWLSKELSFLTGMPKILRDKLLLMPIQAFIDDSGTKGQGRAFAMAGFMAEAHIWECFSEEWHEVLEREPAVSQFKMREAAKFRGEFHKMSKADRDDKVRSLVQILNSDEFMAISCTVDIDAFNKYIVPLQKKPINDPFFLSCQAITRSMCIELLRQKERFELVFDEHSIIGPHVKRWYPVLKLMLTKDEEAVFPTEPLFRNDKEFMPLQAADLLAWLLRRELDGKPHSFGWVVDELKETRRSAHSQHLDEKRLKDIAEKAEKMQSGFSPEFLQVVSDLLCRY